MTNRRASATSEAPSSSSVPRSLDSPFLERLERLDELDEAARIVTDRTAAAPCAVVAAAVRTGGCFRFGVGASGRLSYAEGALVCTPETVFDLASLTKPIVALTLARLERAGVVSRHETLASVLGDDSDLESSPGGRATLDLLTSHRAGLAAHLKLWELFGMGEAGPRPFSAFDPGERVRALSLAARAMREECKGDAPALGFPAVYSDLGYILTGAALETRAEARSQPRGDTRRRVSLDQLVDDYVAAPLQLRVGAARSFGCSFDPKDRALHSAEQAVHVAPTEVVPFRGGLLHGVVHDENAYVLAGTGCAGHAGLFGDAISVARLGAVILDSLAGRDDTFLTTAEIEPLIRVRPGGSHRAGFDGRSAEAPSSGASFGPRTFGHLGFTGTSIWVDPDAELVGVLLTNRVHPTRQNIAIRTARPLVYDAIAAAMTAR